VASVLRDTARCRAVYEQLLPYADYVAVDELWFSFGSVSYFLGLLATALGHGEATQAHFEHAAQRNAALSYEVQACWSRLELARCLDASADPRARARGHSLRERVERQARKLDLRALQHAAQQARPTQQAIRVVHGLGAGRRRSSADSPRSDG
jgi:hypothetical protein